MDQTAADALRAELIEATRRGFDDCRRQTAGQTIYAYALVMASIGEALQPWCHTEETIARQEAKRPSKTPAEAGVRRYHPDEWWATTPEPTRWQELTLAVHAFHLEHGQQPAVTFELFAGTLQTLDAEGYFGTGVARTGVTLMVFISDDDPFGWWRESVRRLNPPAVVKRFTKAVG